VAVVATERLVTVEVVTAQLATAAATEVSRDRKVVLRLVGNAASSVAVVTVIGISVPVEAIAGAVQVVTASKVLLRSSSRSS